MHSQAPLRRSNGSLASRLAGTYGKDIHEVLVVCTQSVTPAVSLDLSRSRYTASAYREPKSIEKIIMCSYRCVIT